MTRQAFKMTVLNKMEYMVTLTMGSHESINIIAKVWFYPLNVVVKVWQLKIVLD